MDVRMPVQEFAMSLNRGDHARHDILVTEQANRFRLQALPGTGREFTQQLAIRNRNAFPQNKVLSGFNRRMTPNTDIMNS